jgi:hypothetical protein
MKESRYINPSDVRLYYFGGKDVLASADEREDRTRKLYEAVSTTRQENTCISIYIKLPSGETIETQSTLIDYTGDCVILRGGFSIPVGAILHVESRDCYNVLAD